MTKPASDFAALQPAIAAALGSLAILCGAFIFQALGYPPCPMCIWQRWPHGIAVVIGLLFFVSRFRPLTILGFLTMLVSSGLGLYHAGVEQKWWPGPSSCTGSTDAFSGMSGMDLLPGAGGDTGLVLCDEIVWDTWGLGITMAGWNFLFSLVFAALWFIAWRKAAAQPA
ncbi:disulfide bond formation protein B [Celeribacter neptunius]|uniref:Disulfide bond formation protein DsbB n=1 Tax=Celeribacter neptunius TaxID=588602 RepID=A0A1I3KXK1_9RHOB|nr:disulfide bond formation protein B [Celeribacter neptunius]SFI77232.1 Disulfide bond formation protein DsbB [Celeribacter neptunius]